MSCCRLDLPSFPLSPSGSLPLTYHRPGGFSIEDADYYIRDHALHWLLCIESYEQVRRFSLGGVNLRYHDIETCLYGSNKSCRIVVAFRGTKDPRKDLYDDKEISMGRVFPRAVEASTFILELIRLNPSFTVELTGHSLGGAIARETAKVVKVQTLIDLKVVTFNSAAPPSFPVVSTLYSVDYHIVFDFVSAWQSPNTIRIDKGFRPSDSFGYQLVPYLWISNLVDMIIPSHSLKNFSNELPGIIVTAEIENSYIQRWFMSLPIRIRVFFIGFFLGSTGGFTTSLPVLK